MATRVQVDWNRLFVVLLAAVVLVVALVWLHRHAPSDADRRVAIPTSVPRRPPDHVELPELISHYANANWRIDAGALARGLTIPVRVLDGQDTDDTVPRRAKSGREWIRITVTLTYTGEPSSAGPRLYLQDVELRPAGQPGSLALSARPIGQDYFPVFDNRAFPPLGFDPGQTEAELELVFDVPAGTSHLILVSASGSASSER